MASFCGADCGACGFGQAQRCAGCEQTDGCPFGRPCFIAKYIRVGGRQAYDAFVDALKREIAQLGIPGMPAPAELFPLNGEYVNLAYHMPSGDCVKLLRDDEVYLACQAESEFSDGEAKRCYGVVANTEFIAVSEYGENGADPELIFYKKR